ncbi:hypothetical protein C2E21_7050 [Chlorella sorokiniana]|uniref:BZIP domain-containing protein n=1 Tax=Chlorella sorokiniana TaxID=3076 RepID=A0A2P6TIR2_CHLSO|nr:hypothetical protein C2E21_7050 [Chlorella sorokiniana]|eukprot:PRW39131.1 hypothetical protein C2E21_7050 [Chlorella sorokiniana]
MAEQLGFSANQLQQLIFEVQRQHEQQQGQQQQGGEPAAAKRARLDAAPAAGVLSLLDAAAACLPTLMPLGSLPLGSLPLLPLNLSGSGSPLLQPAGSGNIGASHTLPAAATAAAAAQDKRQAAQQQQQQQAAAVLPPLVLPPANASGPELLLAALHHQQQLDAALPAQLMQQHLSAGASGHSGQSGGDGTELNRSEGSAEDDGSAETLGRGGSRSHARQPAAPAAGRRSSEDKLTANKEKNRRAQQRFRLRQKEKLSWLESELQRLRDLLTAHGIDPSPNAPLPAGPPAATQPAAGLAVPLAVPHAAGLQCMAPLSPSVEQMYEEVEQILEACGPAIPSGVAIAYLTAWQRADSDTKRCQYSSLKKRRGSGRTAEIATCVNVWLSAAAAAALLPQQQAQQAVHLVSQQAQQAAQQGQHGSRLPAGLPLQAQQTAAATQPPPSLLPPAAPVPIKQE